MSLLRPSRLNSLIRYYAFLVTRLCGFAMGLNLVSKVRTLPCILTVVTLPCILALTLTLTLTPTLTPTKVESPTMASALWCLVAGLLVDNVRQPST